MFFLKDKSQQTYSTKMILKDQIQLELGKRCSNCVRKEKFESFKGLLVLNNENLV